MKIAIAWALLVALMLASLASAYVPLGPWNLVVGVVIATMKALIVLFVFMKLARAPAVLRMCAAIGFATLALLFALSGVDYATREMHAAPMQQPKQVHSHQGGS